MKYGITTGNLLTFRDQAEQDVADVPASFWQGMGAAAEDSFIGSFGPLAYRNVKRGFVEGGGNEDEFASRAIGSIAAPAIMADTLRTAIRGWTNPQGPMLSAEEANDRFAIGDLKFDGPVSLYRAMDLNQTQKNMLRRQDIVNRSQIGFFPQFVAGLGGAALDPVNIAASVLPGGILARTGLALGASSSATLGMRVAYGAAEGALGAAILAPGTYALSAAEARPYSVADALIDVAFGTALGAGLHAGIGAFHNWRKGKGQMPLISQAVEDATYETKVQLARGAVADVIEGRPVNVAPVVGATVANLVDSATPSSPLVRRALARAGDEVSVSPETPRKPAESAGVQDAPESRAKAPAEAEQAVSAPERAVATETVPEGQAPSQASGWSAKVDEAAAQAEAEHKGGARQPDTGARSEFKTGFFVGADPDYDLSVLRGAAKVTKDVRAGFEAGRQFYETVKGDPSFQQWRRPAPAQQNALKRNAAADIARSKLDPWTDPEFKQASTEATQAIEAADTPIKARSEDQGIGSDLPEIREMDRVIEQTDQDLKAMEQLGTLSESDKASLKEADEMVKKAEERGKMRDLAAICLSGAGA